MMRASDFIIVGAGLAGLLSARELRLAGASVTVVEQGAAGRQSSWAGGGILSPLYPWRYPAAVNVLVAQSQRAWPGLCAELYAATGISPEWAPSGMLVLDEAAFEPGLSWSQAVGLSAELIDVAAGSPAHTPIHFPARQALWLPDVGQVRPPRLLAALRQYVEQSGVSILEHHPVTALRIVKEQVRGVVCGAAEFDSSAVVITAGAWSGELLRQHSITLAVRPVCGQMVLLRGEPDVLRAMVLHEGHYLIPRRDGRVLVGSTMEETGFACHTTEAARANLINFASELVPALAHLRYETQWAGLRPGSPTGVPYIGSIEKIQGLFVNAGHFRNGVVMGPGSAQLLADLALKRKPCVDPAPYRWIG